MLVSSRLFPWVFACALLTLAGCKEDAIRTSADRVDFGAHESEQSFDLWNGGDKPKEMTVSLAAGAPWITVDPAELTSRTPVDDLEKGAKAEQLDAYRVVVRLDRTQIAGGDVSTEITISGSRARTVVIPVKAAPPYEAIGTLTRLLDFGPNDNALNFGVWNINTAAEQLSVSVIPSAPWIKIRGQQVVSRNSEDVRTVTVEVDRSLLGGGYHTGEISLVSPGFTEKKIPVRVFKPLQAIGTSHQSLNIGTTMRPFEFEVWNDNPAVDLLNITVAPGADWITVDPAMLSSEKPYNDILDRQLVTVTINRAALPLGAHEGHIDLIPDRSDVYPVRIPVHVTQDESTLPGGLRLTNVQYRYSAPYLLEFTFGLRDDQDAPLVAEPSLFGVSAYENGDDLPPGAGALLKKSAARQLRTDLVLDYSAEMQAREGAIQTMETVIREDFLDALTPESLVGLTLFYDQDRAPTRVAEFTNDRDYIAGLIPRLNGDYVGGMAAGPGALDALYDSVTRFNTADALLEDRYVVFFSSGSDLSVNHTTSEVVDEAKKRRVKIYAIGVGRIPDGRMLNDLTSRTGGRRFNAARPEALANAFRDVIDNLEGQYTLRWATLRRNDAPITPSFVIEHDGKKAQHIEAAPFIPADHAGNTLEGRLRIGAGSAESGGAAVIVRADYVPRGIDKMRLYFRSPLPFDVSLAEAADGGITANWTMTRTPNSDIGGEFIELDGAGEPLAFGDFGPVLRLIFPSVPDESTPLLDFVWVDNDIYTAGQYLVMQNF